MPSRELSPEAREKLSRLAKERHAQGKLGMPHQGKLGGKAKHRKVQRKARITKRVAEAAMEEKNALAIIEVFKDAIHPSQPMHIRLKGAQAWADIATQDAKFELSQEAQTQAHRSREELISILQDKLSSGPTARLITKQIEAETGIVDAEVVEEVSDGDDDAEQ